jgi:hypothetical protein
MQLHQDKAEADKQRERRALNETSRVAIALALTPEKVIERREASEVEWMDWLNAKMREQKAGTPQEILPAVCARIEERVAVISREVGKRVADEVVRTMLGKALK